MTTKVTKETKAKATATAKKATAKAEVKAVENLSIMDRVLQNVADTSKDENNKAFARVTLTQAKKACINDVAESLRNAFFNFKDTETIRTRFEKLVAEYNPTAEQLEKLTSTKEVVTADGNKVTLSVISELGQHVAKAPKSRKTAYGKEVFKTLSALVEDFESGLIKAETAEDIPQWLRLGDLKYFNDKAEIFEKAVQNIVVDPFNDEIVSAFKSDIKKMKDFLKNDTSHGIHEKVVTTPETINNFVTTFEYVTGAWVMDIQHRRDIVAENAKADRIEKAGKMVLSYDDKGKLQVEGLNKDFRRKIKHIATFVEDKVKVKEYAEYIRDYFYIECNDLAGCEDWIKGLKAEIEQAEQVA